MRDSKIPSSERRTPANTRTFAASSTVLTFPPATLAMKYTRINTAAKNASCFAR